MGATRRASAGDVELRLLGPVEALRHGQSVSLGGAKPRIVLATLALEPARVVSTDRLIENVWAASPPETAAHAIQVYVSQLRKALGTEAIATHANGYALELGADVVDVQRFARRADEGHAALGAGDTALAEERLSEALELWRGPALADLAYEPFAQVPIARLDELRLLTVEARLEAKLALGRHVDVIPELESLIEAEPLRERPRAQLMVALYRAGRQADALAVFRSTRTKLVDELGIEPGPELRELEAAILRQDASLRPTAAYAAGATYRRLVTILVVSIDTLTLTATLDPEAAAEVSQRFVAAFTSTVARHGGRREESASDTMVAAFGVPLSHEDDALRAARAALELVQNEGATVRIGIGIETGEVVAGPILTGEPLAIAAELARAAAPGEIVVGEFARRLLAHAATLEPRGELRGYALVTASSTAPALPRRQDAAFVGRDGELAALRGALDAVARGTGPRTVVVLGAAGVGKSRLAAELVKNAHDTTVLQGRCLAYGDGLTYWPLREALEGAPPGKERDAILAALESATPVAANELAFDVRRYCENLARKRPVALVFDDVQWAEPTFLELLHGLALRSARPILIVCLARDELLENESLLPEAERIVLDGLSVENALALLEDLGGATLNERTQERIVEAAGGNPLFVEQLVALALERGPERVLPPTIQALLSTRLDGLGPGQRAVLERGAVVGKEFTLDDVTSLLEPDAADAVGLHLATLTGRGFVRVSADGLYSFRHVLVQEVVYRSTPKRLRADLHEKFATRLESTVAAPVERDELVGHHLEQAYRFRAELNRLDAHTRALAERAGGRLGAAGVRAMKRGDIPAATGFLKRAIVALPREHARRRELLCELGLVLVAAHEPDAAADTLAEAIATARDADDLRVECRARIELEYIRLRREAPRDAGHLLDAATEGIRIFEQAEDERGLGRAWLLAGFVHGGHRGRHEDWREAAERALEHYKAAGWPTSSSIGEIAAAMYWGPTPVEQAVRRCELLLEDDALDLPGTAYLEAFLGGLAAHGADFDRARELVASAAATLDELGLRAAKDTYCTPLRGEIELLAGDAQESARILRELCVRLEQAGDFSHLASRASDVAEALAELGSFNEADEWTRRAERHASADDRNAQMMWRPIRARVHASRGELEVAEELAREAVDLADATDDLCRRGKAHRDLCRVLVLAGANETARAELEHASELFAQKGSVVHVAHVRSLLDDRTPA